MVHRLEESVPLFAFNLIKSILLLATYSVNAYFYLSHDSIRNLIFNSNLLIGPKTVRLGKNLQVIGRRLFKQCVV